MPYETLADLITNIADILHAIIKTVIDNTVHTNIAESFYAIITNIAIHIYFAIIKAIKLAIVLIVLIVFYLMTKFSKP